MMQQYDKMILAILQGDDYHDAVHSLNEHGFYATVLNSSGGFLKKRSVTLMIGLESARLDEALAILKKHGERTEMRYEAPVLSPNMPPIPLSTAPLEIPTRCGGVVLFVLDVAQSARYWVGAAIVNRVSATDLAGRISTFGDIVVFGTYATYIIMSLMMLVMILVLLPMAQVSAVRINEVLDAPISLHEGKTTEAPEQGTVEFRDVSFRYPSSSGDVLEHVSFRANKGETIAFIGATGSGKTTLVSLAARFYDATEGQVLIDGQDVRSYSFDALYDRIGYVTQRAIVFAGDVRSNVLFGESGAPQDDESVQRALSLAQATEFVDKLPGKLDAPIAQAGANVSGGQKQRLSIARALARKPEILIFDDSFSALYYRTDASLRAGLARELSDTTCLIVAQRIGTIRHADRIVVLDEEGEFFRAGLAYAMSKKFVIYFTQKNVVHFAQKYCRILSISPGCYLTPMHQKLIDNQPETAENQLELIPAGRWGHPYEMGALTAFLCSSGAGYVNGVDILADGGQNAGIFVPQI